MGRLGTTVDVGLAVSMPVRRQHERRSSTTSALGATRRRHGEPMARLLTLMSSGVRFNENFPPGFTPDDTLQLILDTYARLGPGGVGAVTSFNDRERPAGTKFSYASVETQVLELVLARAIDRPIVEYLEQKIWQPIGAEADATWLVDNSGQEAVYCCLNAVLRDYARLGLLLAHDGN
jgi:CubicO group peptidase (beta-lactamase class C family)